MITKWQKDEWYPIFFLEEHASYSGGIDLDVPEDLLKAYKDTHEAFVEVQDRLYNIYVETRGRRGFNN